MRSPGRFLSRRQVCVLGRLILEVEVSMDWIAGRPVLLGGISNKKASKHKTPLYHKAFGVLFPWVKLGPCKRAEGWFWGWCREIPTLPGHEHVQLLYSVVMITGAAGNIWEGIRSNQEERKLGIMTCNWSLCNPFFQPPKWIFTVSWF